MHTIILAAIGTLGDIEPSISIAHALKSLGLRSILLVNDQWVDHIEKFGLEVYSIGDTRVASSITEEAFEAGYDGSDWSDHIKTASHGWYTWGVPCTEKMYTLSLKFIEETQPIAVIAHFLAVGAAWAAIKSAIPYSVTFPQPGALFLAQSKTYKKGKLLLAILRQCNVLLKKICRSLEIKWTSSIWEDTIQQADNHLGLWSPVLSLPASERFPKLTVCGFPKLLSDPCPEEILTFLTQGTPPIAFGLGTNAVSVAGGFFEDAIQVCAELNCRGLFFCGRHVPPHLPNQILGVQFAPYSIVFPRCAAVVHHGGINTCATALRSKRPMVIVPYLGDQFQNATMLENLGVSLTLRRTDLSARTLKHSLQQVLTQTMLQRAEELGTIINDEQDGAYVAAEKILENCTPMDSNVYTDQS